MTADEEGAGVPVREGLGGVPVRRPLTGEPLPLDLLNTTWVEDGVGFDLLDTVAGVAEWLTERDLDLKAATVSRVAPTLRGAREAIRQSLTHPTNAAAHDALNAVLARGHLRSRLSPDGPQTVVEIDDGRWLVAWRAAHELVELLRQRPQRVRRCGNPDCVLWFLDTTRSATRRWCSMAACGNRNKVHRHRHGHD